MYGVANEDHGILTAAYSEEGCAGCMARMYGRADSRQDFLAILESLQPPLVEIGTKRRLGFAEIIFGISKPIGAPGTEKEIDVGFADVNYRVGE